MQRAVAGFAADSGRTLRYFGQRVRLATFWGKTGPPGSNNGHLATPDGGDLGLIRIVLKAGAVRAYVIRLCQAAPARRRDVMDRNDSYDHGQMDQHRRCGLAFPRHASD